MITRVSSGITMTGKTRAFSGSGHDVADGVTNACSRRLSG